jgi:hypothetical protein
MKLSLIISILIICGCEQTATHNQNNVLHHQNNIDVNSNFCYDAIDFYFKEFRSSEIDSIYYNRSASEMASIKNEIALGEIPHTINDTSFINILKIMGYQKQQIDSPIFKKLNEIFTNKKSNDGVSTKCKMPEYRDILIFKNKGKITGVAKICFTCLKIQMSGLQNYASNFGAQEDYTRLSILLHQLKK